MTTFIKKVIGSSKEEIEKKKFNIYIGISLGNKWFTKKNIREYIVWALKHTKNKVVILIADKLHSINYEIRGGYNHERAVKKALREGNKFLKLLKGIISGLPDEKKEKIDIIRWEKLEKISEHKKAVKILYREFNKNKDFKKHISRIVKQSMEKEFSEKEIEKLSYYVLNELPEMLRGFYYKKDYYNAYIYPFYMSVADFVEKLQKKKLFPRLYDKLGIMKTIVIELKVN